MDHLCFFRDQADLCADVMARTQDPDLREELREAHETWLGLARSWEAPCTANRMVWGRPN